MISFLFTIGKIHTHTHIQHACDHPDKPFPIFRKGAQPLYKNGSSSSSNVRSPYFYQQWVKQLCPFANHRSMKSHFIISVMYISLNSTQFEQFCPYFSWLVCLFLVKFSCQNLHIYTYICIQILHTIYIIYIINFNLIHYLLCKILPNLFSVQ